MSTVYAQVPLRLEASIVSNPPVDSNTGLAPKFYRGQSVAVQAAIFDPSNVAVDLTNIASLTLTLQAAADSLVPLVTKTVVAADIIPTITRAAWLAGTAQQATFLWSKAETDQSLAGLNQNDLWLVLTGITLDGTPITYSAGPVTCYNAGINVPLPPFGYVSRNAQTNAAGNTTVQPTSLSHTEVIEIDGAARTSQIILATVGITDGAVLRLFFTLPATADIVVQIKNAISGGTQLATFTTGSVLNGHIELVYDEADATWQSILEVFPAKY